MLAQLFKQPDTVVETWVHGFQQTASRLGLPFGNLRKTFNSRLAQEVGLWAEKQGKGDLFHLAAFQAYLVGERNIARKEVLLQLVDQVGLSGPAAETIIDQRVFREAVDNDWTLARRLNITAVPTFVMGENRLVGAQPYETIARFVIGGKQ